METKRTVPLTPELVEMLKRQREEFVLRFGRDSGPNDPLFFDEDSGEPRPMEHTEVKPESLNFSGAHVKLWHATVGFDRMDRRHVSRVAKVLSDEFGFRIKPFKAFQDRVTFAIKRDVEISATRLSSVLRKVRSTPPVNFADLWFSRQSIQYIFECDDPKEIRAAFS